MESGDGGSAFLCIDGRTPGGACLQFLRGFEST